MSCALLCEMANKDLSITQATLWDVTVLVCASCVTDLLSSGTLLPGPSCPCSGTDSGVVCSSAGRAAGGAGLTFCGSSESCGSVPSPTAAACAGVAPVAAWTVPAGADWMVALWKE